MLSGRLRREQRGETLMELLVAMSMAAVVLYALLQVFVGTLQANARTEDRVESTVRARGAVERIVGQLASQVCADPITAPVKPGATASSLDFYVDQPVPSTTTTPTADAPRLRRLTFDPVAGTIVLRSWSTTAEAGTPTVRTLATGVAAPSGRTGPFRFYAYNDTSGGAVPTPDTEQVPASGGLTAAQVELTVRVRVELVARPSRPGAPASRQRALAGDAYVGSLDPVQPELGARCAA